MRRLQIVAAVAFAFIASAAVAQDDPKNAIKLNFLSPIVQTLNLSYERTTGPSQSFQLGFYYTGAKSRDVKLRGFGITPEYRFYLGEEKPAPDGFYIAPFLRYTKYDLTSEADQDQQTSRGTYTSFGGGFVVGRQWVFKKRATFDMFIGPKMQSRNVTTNSGNDDDFNIGLFGRFGLRAGVTVGLAF